ncbi:hypothetical protein N9P71_00975 [Saprospiraceae bacterium]|nr:hypothetical protein [Saprospiraceae bacterium]
MKTINLLLFNIVRRIFRKPLERDRTLSIRLIGSQEIEVYTERIKWYLPGIEFTLHSNKIKNADIVFVADINAINYSNFLLNAHKTYIVDPNFYSNTEVSNWVSAYFNILAKEEKDKYAKLSQDNFKKFLSVYNSYENAYLFGSGPSIEKYNQHIYKENSIRIICNSLIKNKKFIDFINPTAIVAADPLFHFGHSKYAKKFRNDLIDTIKKYNCTLFVPQFNLPMFLKHYPQLKQNIIGLNFQTSINIPNRKNVSVKGTENIFTLMMLPIACSIAKHIFVIGMDGKDPSKKNDYFWEHHGEFQYVDLMEETQKLHNSFFRDRDYIHYFENHCNEVNLLIEYIESQNKTVITLEKSNIPAFQSRISINS